MKSILICSPDDKWASELAEKLKPQGHVISHVKSGKDCQQLLYQKNQDYLFLDLKTSNHSCFEVLKYVKLNHIPLDVSLYAPNAEALRTLEIDDVLLKRLGVNQSFYGTASIPKIVLHLTQNDPSRWRKVGQDDSQNQSTEKKNSRSEFYPHKNQ